MHLFFYTATVLASTLTFAAATGFDASSNSNVAVYWGQGSNQKPLHYFCDDDSIDIIPIGFVNVFPDQEGANGYPGTNFGNACGGSYYKSPEGKETRLLESCAQIGSDIQYCQSKGKKILLSLGGASPDVYIATESSAKDMADFLWGAFGPAKHTWEGPRPFGEAYVNGFDFDIESHASNITGLVDFGYAIMVDYFRHLFAAEEETYYISGAPQCVVPDSHLSDAISKSVFDFLFVQFYNTPSCSARAGLDHSYGAYGGPATDISYDAWVDHVKTKSANKEAKIYMGLAAAMPATYGSMYLSPEEAQQLIETYQCKWPTMFGGVMLWEATFSENNQINGMSYGQNIKKGLQSCSCATTPSTSSVVTSSTMLPTSVPTASSMSMWTSSAEYPTSSLSASLSSTDYPASSSAEYETSSSTESSTSSPTEYETSSSTESSTSSPTEYQMSSSTEYLTLSPTENSISSSAASSSSTDYSTSSSTEYSTSSPTEYLTLSPTEYPISSSTASSSSTESPTSSPTEYETSSSTESSTSSPTEYETSSPTENPTSSSAEYETSSSAEYPTSSSTEYPTSSSAEYETSSSAEYLTSSSTEYPTSSSAEYETSSSAEYLTSSSTEYPTSSSGYPISGSTGSSSTPVTSSSPNMESSSYFESSATTSFTTTHDEISVSSTASATASASPSSCGVKGFDKAPAYNFLNDTASANFEKCFARCSADSTCVSFAFGLTQCLLYTQTVATNVNEVSTSPFTFYDKTCSAPSSTISSSMSSSISSVVSSSQTSSEMTTSSTYVETSSSEAHPTGSVDSTSGYPYPTESMDSTSSEQEAYPTTSGMVSSSYIVASSASVESPIITSAPTDSSSEIPTEEPETVISYVDVTTTSCPPDVTNCPAKSNGGAPPAQVSSSSANYPTSSPLSSSSVVGPIESSSTPGTSPYPVTNSGMPSQSSNSPEMYTTVITTHYVGICPTGYTTIPYTTTVVTTSGADSPSVATTEIPAGFTTTVAVCPACNSASPTVTITVPVVSVVPVPVATDTLSGFPPAASPSGASPSGGSSSGASLSGGSPSAGSPPAAYSSEGSPAGGVSLAGSPAVSSSPAGYTAPAPAPQTSSPTPAGYTPSPPAPPKSSAPPVTTLSPKPTSSSPGFSNGVPTIATPPYNAGNATASFKTHPASGGSLTTGFNTGLSGAEATRPAAYTGGASKASEGTFVAVVIAAIWAGLVMV